MRKRKNAYGEEIDPVIDHCYREIPQGEKKEKRKFGRKKRKFNFSHIGWIIFVVAIILYIGMALHVDTTRLQDAQTATAECEVVDKHYTSQTKSGTRSYYLVLKFENEVCMFNGKISLENEDDYWNTQVGDVILCDVIYDDIGIMQINVVDGSVDQYTANEEIRIAIWYSLFFSGIFAATGGLFSFMLRDKHEKDEEDEEDEPADIGLKKYHVTLQLAEGWEEDEYTIITVDVMAADPDDAVSEAKEWLDPAFDFEAREVIEIKNGT